MGDVGRAAAAAESAEDSAAAAWAEVEEGVRARPWKEEEEAALLCTDEDDARARGVVDEAGR